VGRERVKLASLRGGRDGVLAVVDGELRRAAPVPEIAPTLQAALDDWDAALPRLARVAAALARGEHAGALPFDPAQTAAPLPRAYQWADGSAYVHHIERVRRARGAQMPPEFWTDPLIYQGGSDHLLGAHDDIEAGDESFGIDFEAEVAVITGDVPMAATPARAQAEIRLLVLVNDVSLRNLIPGELAKGFGFFQSKPASALSPVAVTPDELGDAWDGSKLHLPITATVNGQWFGAPEAGEDMTFDFPTLIAHAARTRRLGAGTLLGAGTVSNLDTSRGCACIAERRTLETLEHGAPRTPFLRFGDRVRIEMLDRSGRSVFGAIDQRVVQAKS
jgi:fumarylacetoacetate (FAA) hydrolase